MKESVKFYLYIIYHHGGGIMKKLILAICSILLLCGCTPKAYTANMTKGEAAFKDGDFEKSAKFFKKAQKEKDTDEVNDLITLSNLLFESKSAIATGDFETSIEKATKVKEYKGKTKLLPHAKKEADKLLKEANNLLTAKNKIEESMTKGKELLTQNKFDDAYNIFSDARKIDVLNNKKLVNLKSQLTDLMNQTIDEKKAYNDKLEKEKVEKDKEKAEENKQNEKQNEDQQPKAGEDNKKQEETNHVLSHSEAEQLVREYLNIQSDKNIFTRYDHDEGDNYIIHVYEKVIDDPKTNMGHTATWGWYGVNKYTKKVYDYLNN